MVKVSEVSGCSGCPLASKFPNARFVPVKWTDGDRLVVGEAAGADEELQGKPFVGASGKVLQGLYRKAGVNWDSLTIVNTLSCRPDKNDYPTSPEARRYCTKQEGEAAVAHCKRAHLDPVLHGREWKRIDALGSHALEAVTGKDSISKWRGMPLEPLHALGKPIVLGTLHPSYLMRQQEMMPVVVSDLRKTMVLPPEDFNLFPSLGDVQDFTATEFSFDIESNRWKHDEIYLVGLSSERFKATVVPFKGPYIAELKRIFRNAKVVKGQNIIGFDLVSLEANGILLSRDCEIRDIMLMHALLQPDLDHDLEFIASLYSNRQAWKHLSDTQKEYYNAVDTAIISEIEPQLWSLLKQQGLEPTYSRVSVPVAKIVTLMTKKGVKVDTSQISKVRERIKEQQEGLEQQLPGPLRTSTVPANKRIAAPPGTIGKSGKPLKFIKVASSEVVVPWRSDKSVGKWLYEDLKLPVQKHIKTGKVSTDKYSLERLARSASHSEKQAILAIKELRSLDETLTTFAKEKMEFGTSIHPHFSVHGTNSGRLSSSGPNAQNIPEALRVIYIPSKADMYIVQADFSGIENRLTAHLAHDTDRLARFNQPGFSEHKWAVEQFFGIPAAEVQKSSDPNSPYSKAKHIVHGSNYGLGARKMSLMYGVPEREVKQLLSKWKASIPKTFNWQDYTAGMAKLNGVLTNPFGRKRWFGTSSYYTESLSFLPQSTGADIILRCMLGLYYDRIAWPESEVLRVCPVFRAMPQGADLLIQVHDSLVWQCSRGQLDQVVENLKLVMEQRWLELGGFSCPIEVQFGESWGDMEVYK